MNEDYLYNKTGEDAEIENLENLLKDFRLQNTNAPMLPAKVVVFQTKPRRKTFRYAFAIAAGLIIAALIGIFALNSNKQKDFIAEKVDKKVTPSNEVILPPVEPTVTQNVDFRQSVSKLKPQIKPIKVNRFIQKIMFQRDAPKQINIKKVEKLNQTVKLTDEEQFAYDQVKLALSITSEKLKIVKEKIDNAENNVSVTNEKVVAK